MGQYLYSGVVGLSSFVSTRSQNVTVYWSQICCWLWTYAIFTKYFIRIQKWWWQNVCDPVHQMIKLSGCAALLLCCIKTETLWWNCLIRNSHEILNYVKQYVDLCGYSQKEKSHTEMHNWHHLFMLRICFSLRGSYLGALSTPICQGQ